MCSGWICLAGIGLLGCGRIGFDARDSSELSPLKPDSSLVAGVDAIGSSVDSPIGFGTYQVTDTTAPYLSPIGAQLVPGFANGADDENYQLPLPFAFTFYGIVYNVVWVSVNGFIAFNGPVAASDSLNNDCPIDATPPDGMIAVFWDDLFATSSTPPYGSISYLAEGTTPDQRFTI